MFDDHLPIRGEQGSDAGEKLFVGLEGVGDVDRIFLEELAFFLRE